MKINMFLLSLSLLFSIPKSFAALQTKEITIRCDKTTEIKQGTLMMEFNSLNWSWQCDDLEPFGRKSYVWIHPSPMILEIENDVYEVDVMKSDKECNQGELTSYYGQEASCGALASEFVNRGMHTIYNKSWNVGSRSYYNGHGFYVKNAAGAEIYINVEMENWSSVYFEAKGTYSDSKTGENCSYLPR